MERDMFHLICVNAKVNGTSILFRKGGGWILFGLNFMNHFKVDQLPGVEIVDI
jgi:hypothetical protein